MRNYKRIFKEIDMNEKHDVDITMNMDKDELIDALFLASEDEDTNSFKRGWSQLNSSYKQKFINQFKNKYTNDTMDKMFFILQSLI